MAERASDLFDEYIYRVKETGKGGEKEEAAYSVVATSEEFAGLWQVIRMVRKRWRGVAPYFYTVWPLLCIILHLARSSRDAVSGYADLSLLLGAKVYCVTPRRLFSLLFYSPSRISSFLCVTLWRNSKRAFPLLRKDPAPGNVLREMMNDATGPWSARSISLLLLLCQHLRARFVFSYTQLWSIFSTWLFCMFSLPP